MSKISQIQVDRLTYNVCDTSLRNLIDWRSKHQWNVYETDDGTNITTHALPAKTMNSSNHPYTSYQNYIIFEDIDARRSLHWNLSYFGYLWFSRRSK